MKLSFDWLCDYVDLTGITPEQVAEKLTMGAFEVEEVRQIRGEIVGPVVVGEILEIYPHPNANKIRLTKTRVAEGAEPLEIVCGADNIQVGQRIPVALSGARVIDRKTGKPLPIEAREVRGVVSNGMLCSPPELGLDAGDNEGILVLPHGAENPITLGTNIIEYLYLRPDWVLHVEPRSNRGDALSVIGLAREVAALLNRKLKQPEWKLPEQTVKQELDFAVEIERSDDCPFFSARVIANVTPGESPAYIKRRLEAVDVRTVNSVVDITNYVMHEYGQPLHAYDYSQIKGHKLSVRRARSGEKLTTLDGKERELNDETLVITDGAEPVGVAGVMGGKDSEISDHTGNVVLEAASFQAARVRRGSRLLGLSSDSSLRFERGVDPASVAKASDRASYLILQHCGTADSKPALGMLAVAGHDSVRPIHVTCRMKELKRVLGADFSPEQVKSLLTPLGFEVVKGCSANEQDKEAVQVSVPSFRQNDVTREIDIVEEVCRLWGYENLPESMPSSSVAPERQDRIQDTARDVLSGLGLSEAWLSSLTSGDEELFGLFDETRAVRVLNPLSADHQVLRQSLLPGLIRSASYNYDRGQQEVWLFEVARVYLNMGRETVVEHDRFRSGTGVVEERHAAGIMMGRNSLSEWADHRKRETSSELDFYYAKGVVENLLRKLRIDADKIQYVRSDKVPACMHPSRTCQVVFAKRGKGGEQLQVLGWIGEMHPGLRETFRFKEPAYLFEINLDGLPRPAATHKFKDIPSNPAVSRDLTGIFYEAVDHSAVHSVIRSAAGANLRSLELVSIYQPQEGQKSLSFRFNFQSAEKTLTNEEVDTILNKVRQQLTSRLSASFQG